MNANLPFLRISAKLLPLLLSAAPAVCFAQHTYQKPPQAVLDILHAPITPDVSLSPTRDRLLLIERERYPSIAELAEPMLPLAGLRINPRNNGPHEAPRNTGITIQTIPDGERTQVKLPGSPPLPARPIFSSSSRAMPFSMEPPCRLSVCPKR